VIPHTGVINSSPTEKKSHRKRSEINESPKPKIIGQNDLSQNDKNAFNHFDFTDFDFMASADHS
jgi:hypothetical protein